MNVEWSSIVRVQKKRHAPTCRDLLRAPATRAMSALEASAKVSAPHIDFAAFARFSLKMDAAFRRTKLRRTNFHP